MATTELSADTRARILETAWERAREHGTAGVSVKDIAAAAGVSRQLVYFHYRSRAGLLLAMARHHDDRSGFRRRVAATRALPPADALEALLREWCDYLPELLPVARALEAAAIHGDEGGDALRDRMDDLWLAFKLAVDRVAGDGRLAGGWTAEAATDWITARVHPSTYAHLVTERGWAHDEFAARTTRAVLAELVAA